MGSENEGKEIVLQAWGEYKKYFNTEEKLELLLLYLEDKDLLYQSG